MCSLRYTTIRAASVLRGGLLLSKAAHFACAGTCLRNAFAGD